MILHRKSNPLCKEELIKRIIDVAYNIIDSNGYEQLSTRKIAQEVGYTVGNLYNLFPGIDYIILAVNQKILKDIMIRLQQAVANPYSYPAIPGIPAAAIAIAMAYYDFSHQHFYLWNTVFERNVSENIDIPETYKEEIKKLYQFIGTILSQYEFNDEKLQIKIALFWSGMHGIASLSNHKKFANINIASVHKLIISFLQDFFCNYS